MTIYRVRNTRTGLYSRGGLYVRWTKRGKIWTTKGALKNHFNRVLRSNEYRTINVLPQEWVVESYDLTANAQAIQCMEFLTL